MPTTYPLLCQALQLTKEKCTMHGLFIPTKLIVISLAGMIRSKSIN